MKLSNKSIEVLEQILDGNSDLTPYKSGPELVDFFEDYGFDDEYGQGFPSRWYYTQENLKELNGTDTLRELVESYFHPINFIDTDFDLTEVIDHLNSYLKFDGYQLEKFGKEYKVINVEDDLVEIEDVAILNSGEVNQKYIQEQIEKSRKKIGQEDFDGAITNARSLLETILVEIEGQLIEDPPEYDGKLNKLFNRVREQLNLDPSREDLNDRLKEILSGLISVVYGMAGLRNRMSDAHVRKYRPEKHHAKLAVNAVNTICDFLIATYEYQRKRSLIDEE